MLQMLTTLKWQWKPIKMNRNKLEIQEVTDDLNQLEIAQIWNPPPRKAHPDTSRLYSQPNPLSSRAPEFIWNQVRSYASPLRIQPKVFQVSHQIHKPRPPICPLALRSPLGDKKPRWPSDYGLSKLKCSRSFKESPGCKIVMIYYGIHFTHIHRFLQLLTGLNRRDPGQPLLVGL